MSERTIRRWIAHGDLPARRIGPRTIRIRQADLERIGKPVTPLAADRRVSA